MKIKINILLKFVDSLCDTIWGSPGGFFLFMEEMILNHIKTFNLQVLLIK